MKITKENYFETLVNDHNVPIMSSSMIKKALPMNGGDSYSIESAWNKQNVEKEKQTSALKTGTIIHAYVENPQKLYVIPELEISDALKEITESFIGKTNVTDEEIIFTCKTYNYGKGKWKDETLVSKWNEGGGPKYLEAISSSIGKIIVTAKELTDFTGMKTSLEENEEVSGYFIKSFNESDKIEVLSEFPVLHEYNGLLFKSLIDRMILNHKDKKATVLDLKSTKDSPASFESSYTYVVEDGMIRSKAYGGAYVSFKYFIQEELYKNAIRTFLNENGYVDYELEFKFGLIENKTPYRSAMFQSNKGWAHIAKIELDIACEHVHRWFDRSDFDKF